MADVYVNALTTISTEPTTTDSLVAVNRNTNEGKIIDYNKLADVILNKLTSKTYSGLNTTSKLLVGAINELDSDVSSLSSSLGSGIVSLLNAPFSVLSIAESSHQNQAFAEAIYAEAAKKGSRYLSIFNISRSGGAYMAIVQYVSENYGTILLIQYGNLHIWQLVGGTWTFKTVATT